MSKDDKAAIFGLILCVLVLGSCGATVVRCWQRGGTVLRNAFDWPTCVEVRKR